VGGSALALFAFLIVTALCGCPPPPGAPECRKGGRLDVIHWDTWP